MRRLAQLVGRSPWTAADALVGLAGPWSRTRGSGADEGVRPTQLLFTVVLWFGLLSLRVEGRWALTVFQLAMFAMAAVLIVRRRFAIRPHPVALLLAAAALWGVIQVVAGTSVDPHRTLEAALRWIVNCAGFSIGATVNSRRFLTAQVIFALLLSVAAVIGLLTVSQLGPFVYKNQFANYMECMLGLAIVAAIQDRPRSLAWLLVAGAIFASVVAAGSRAGSILCLAELILLPAIAFARGWISGRALLRVSMLGALTGGALVVVAGWENTWQRLHEQNPYSLRADLLRSSVDMTRDRPLAGSGLGTWSTAYPRYARFDDGNFVNEAHNDWAQWAAEGGLPLLLIMASIVALLLRPAFDSLWGLGLMAVFVHAWVDYPFEQRPALAAFFFAMAGIISSSSTFSQAIHHPDGPSRV